MATRNRVTEFFTFDSFTWPEVADLHRNIPLVLPLGTGWDMKLLSEQLNYPAKAGILPAMPFGWQESGLVVQEALLFQYISNLLGSLRDDGFTSLYCLVPQGMNRQFLDQHPKPGSIIVQPYRLESSSPVLLPPDTERGKVILIPIGHTEQHGLHLPLLVDTVIIEAIANGVAARLPTRTYALPVTPYGVSTHRESFAGTLNAGGRAFEDFWVAVIDSLVARGFDRFYFMSGHGGNMSFLTNVVKYAGERHRRIFCATSFLHTSGPKGAAAIEKHRTSNLGGMGHACELETSYMLHLRPKLCHMERTVDETDFITTPSYYMDWIEGGSLIANPSWDDDTKTGAYGAGTHATAEKGRLWLEAAINEKIDHVVEIHEQHERREERRKSGYGRWGKINN